MIVLRKLLMCSLNSRSKQRILSQLTQTNSFHASNVCNKQKKEEEQSRTVVRYAFEEIADKKKETFLEAIRIYTNRDVNKRGHVEFILQALQYMEEFGVHKDLETYKRLLDVFPKGKMIPTNTIQAAFQHYPKHQQCALDVLEKMEDNWVIPDRETEDILLNVFGESGYPLRKLWRMLYWMSKMKNINPWPWPDPLPNDTLELAKLAIEKISSIDVQSVVEVYQTDTIKESIDKTWIVSALSVSQVNLLNKHDASKPIFVEGPSKVWVGSKSVDYFVLRGDPIRKPYPSDYNIDDVSNLKIPFWEETNELLVPPTVHEQEDATIFSICATGTSSKDSLLSWIRCLQKNHPVLGTLSIVFKLYSPTRDITFIEGEPESDVNKEEDKQKTLNDR